MLRNSALIGMLLLAASASPQKIASKHADPMPSTDSVCDNCIRAHEEFLASDVLGGRGLGTRDELVAATYIASQLRQYGVEPFAWFAGGVAGQAAGANPFIQELTVDLGLSPAKLAKLPPQFASGKLSTRNVIGVVRGSDAKLKDEYILLSAHLDHLGTQPQRAVSGDAIFNGADDDASGVAAVLELARIFVSGPPLRRSVIFSFFGSEEMGTFARSVPTPGARYFLAHCGIPLNNIVADLEFEMIGRPDPAVRPDQLWLTGYDRSTLGAALAQHGAHLVADPHPAENFFKRSDNYELAKLGLIAHTVSSFGLHRQYHQPDDDIAHLDFAHMDEVIGSMIEPLRWLANSDFRPQWVAGRQP
jgi:hypothetical protein